MLAERRRRSLLILALLVALVGATLLLRLWSLNSLPPGLWWDEASQGLDARDLLHGHFRVFFSRAEGKEPLYIYLSTPFVAVWNGQPFAVRLAGALMGGLMVFALFLAGRALWRQQPGVGAWVGAVAAGLWAVNYWPQSMNRIGFQVNALPLAITLAIVTWLNWTNRPGRRRAAVFGLMAGLTMATYLAARFTPLIWLVLYAALPAVQRRSLRPTLVWAGLGFALIVAPLAVHFALHPNDFANRASVFPLIRGDYGKEFWEPLAASAKEVAGAFLGWSGDPNYRHNIPGRPAFSPLLATLFALGVVTAIISLRRRSDPRGWTLLTWLLVLSVPSVLSLASNPHYPRLFGALPAAFLLAAWPLAALASRAARRGPAWRGAAVLGVALFLAAEGVATVHDYFVTWRQIDLYDAFNGDTMLLGRRIQASPGTTAVVPIYGDATHVLDYAFPDAPILEVQLDEETIAGWLASHLAGGAGQQVLVPVWNVDPWTLADPQQAVPFYLQREGILVKEEHLRNFDLLGYRLGQAPAFDAQGNRVTLDQAFSSQVKLVEARWGAAYPNADRSGASAAAGSPFWVILTWQLQQPMPGLRASVDLVDAGRHRLSHADQQLMRLGQGDPPPPWTPNTLVHTYHLVDAPATQLPGPVTLEARLYDSETLAPVIPADGAAAARGSIILAQATVAAPEQPAPDTAWATERPIGAAVGPGLTLLGLDAWPDAVQPGDRLTLRLYWQAQQPLPTDQPFTIALGDTGVAVDGALPANMPAGRPVHTFADLRLPPDIEPGRYPLLLRTSQHGVSAGSNVEGQPVTLGEVEVSGRPRRYEAPSLKIPVRADFGDLVALLGVDTEAPIEVAPGQAITLTLAWQALAAPGQDLVRFVHLLDGAGRLVAQRDSRPCDGGCPAASWLPGEVLVEDARLTLPADLPAGAYRLAAGWYDAATLQRLRAVDAAGQPLADDLVILPIEVRVGR